MLRLLSRLLRRGLERDLRLRLLLCLAGESESEESEESSEEELELVEQGLGGGLASSPATGSLMWKICEKKSKTHFLKTIFARALVD